MTVGVLDMGFGTTDADYKAEMTNKFNLRLEKVISFGTPTSNENHGIIVAEVVGGNTIGIAKGVNIVGVDITKVNGTKLSPDPTLPAYNYLYDTKGVRIFNQSFGIAEEVTDYVGTLAIIKRNDYKFQINNGGTEDILGFYKKAVNNGALFIWSAGNDRFKKNPTLEGGLPHLEADLEKGWINVVGLARDFPIDPGSTDWEDLERLNGAGVAKNWTVTAVSGITVSTKENGVKGTYQMNGSSFAAPMVTGTAALIKQKYPWMDGSLIRQTILSTATDIGKTGVDEDFGWGLLNIDKAVKGPALFDTRLALGSNVEANVTSGIHVFGNDISGDAGFVKNGPGTIRFDGKLTYTGNTVINGGSLVIKGTTYNTGSTKITFGNLTLAENVNVANSIMNENGEFTVEGNNVTVGGNYVAEQAARTTLNAASNVHIKGEVALNSSTLVLKSEKDGEAQYVTAKGVEAAITSDNKINGEFGNVETADMLKGTVENSSDNTVNTKLSRKNVTEYVADGQLSDSMRDNVAQNLETAFTKLDSQIETGTEINETAFAKSAAQIQTMSLPTAAAVLDSLSGQIYASAQALTFQQSQTVNKDLSNRLTMLGTLENTGEKAGLWVTGIGAGGKLREDGYGTGKTKVAGGQVGVDKKFGDNLILGTALAYSNADVKFDRYGGESKANNFGISLYGRLGNKSNPFYVQGRVGLGFVQSDVERDIILSSSSTSRAKIDHSDKVYSGYLETGYDVKKGNFTFTPYIGISHDTVQRGAFSEENSQFGLTAGKATYHQTNGIVGLRASQGINWRSGSKTTLQGYVNHQIGFNDEDLSFDATYTGLPSATFTVKGIGLAKDRTWMGIGALTEVNPGFAWYVNYDVKLEKGKINNNVFTTGFRINFD